MSKHWHSSFQKNIHRRVKKIIKPWNNKKKRLCLILSSVTQLLHKQHFAVSFRFHFLPRQQLLLQRDGCWRAADRHPSVRKHHCILCWASISHLLTDQCSAKTAKVSTSEASWRRPHTVSHHFEYSMCVFVCEPSRLTFWAFIVGNTQVSLHN